MKENKNSAETYQDIAILIRHGASWLRQRDFYQQAENRGYHTLKETFVVLKKSNKPMPDNNKNNGSNLHQAYLGNLKKYVITKLPNYLEKVADDFEAKSK